MPTRLAWLHFGSMHIPLLNLECGHCLALAKEILAEVTRAEGMPSCALV